MCEKTTEKPIRILHVVTHMNRGGLETMIMNYYRHINRNKIQFDFLTHRPENEKKDYDDEIRSLGGKIYHLPMLNPLSLTYKKALNKFFREHKEYQIVHSHLDCMSTYPLKAAKKYGVKVRIAHAHTSQLDTNWKKYLKLYSKKKISLYATNLFACSKVSGNWMFDNNKYDLFYNAIDADKYQFDSAIRKKIRIELGIEEDTFVIGHIGNFTLPKNHEFVLKLFKKIKEQKRIKLVLVGDGSRRELIEKMLDELKLRDSVILTGVRNDVPELLQAFDVFVLPSVYEGFPVALVEAQAAGLKCLVSDAVTKEAQILPSTKYLALDNIDNWEIELSKDSERNLNAIEKIKVAGFDIKERAKWLEEFYINAIR